MPYKNPEKRKKYQRKYYKANIGRAKALQKKYRNSKRGKQNQLGSHLKCAYNLSYNEYQERTAQQNGVCAICRKPETAKFNGVVKNLSVDHNHKTGEIRGLLCHNCNVILGYAKESTTTLLYAIDYLRSRS